MTSTRVIDLPQDLPAERADDRNEAAGPSGAHTVAGGRRQPDASSPGDAALKALARLLARQVAEEWFRSQRG